MTLSSSRGRRFFAACLIPFASGSLGCSSVGGLEEVHERESAFTSAQERVLGFEDVASDWTIATGTLTSASTASAGLRAAAVVPNGWTVLQSAPLSSLGALGTEVSIDVAVPAALSWGEVRIVLESPQASIWWGELGVQNLVGLSPGTYHTLRFTLPESMRTRLAGSYSDLRIRVILNAPAAGSPYRFDRLRLTPESSGGGSTGEHRLVMELPVPAQPQASALVALQELRINDGADIIRERESPEPAGVISLGSINTNIGVQATVGNVTSASSVFLRDRAKVFGSLKTGGTVIAGVDTQVLGTTLQNEPVPPGSVEFSLQFGTSGPSVTSATQPNPAPGRYDRVSVQAGNLTFRSGVYELNDLSVSAGSTLNIDSSGGPVVVLVTGSATFHGRVEGPGGSYPRWVLGYSGESDVHFTRELRGAVFAPNTRVVAASDYRHEGAVVGERVDIHQRSTFVHTYHREEWRALCDAVGGTGGFCGASVVRTAGGIPDCVFALQPWAVGRNGHDAKFNLGDLGPLALPFAEGIAYNLLQAELSDTRTPRGFAYSFTDNLKSDKAFGQNWDSDSTATAVLWADIDGDGKQEVIFGRDAHDHERLYVYDDADHGFELLQQMFDGWDHRIGVLALARGDYDNDGRDEIAVARGASSDHQEVYILDGVNVPGPSNGTCAGTKVELQEVGTIGVGDRDAKDVEFGDFDGDGYLELAIAKGGRNGSPVPRVRVVDIEERSPAEWNVGALSKEFADTWGSERDATALAAGDLEGDGTTEIAVGRSEGDNQRWSVYRYNAQTGAYDAVYSGGDGWGSDRMASQLAFGDLDGDGDDELVVGRDGNTGCVDDCSKTPRVYVYDYQGGSELKTLVELGGSWTAKIGVDSLDTGDVDGDGKDEIVVGLSKDDGSRVFIFDGPHENFAELTNLGNSWGKDRAASALDVSDQYVCQSYVAKAVPPNTTAASGSMNERIASVIQSSLHEVRNNLNCLPPGNDLEERSVALFGPWEHGRANTAGHRILAGLAAIQLGKAAPGAQDAEIPALSVVAHELLEARFVDMANAYLATKLEKFADVGTGSDFDFELSMLAGLLYRFRTAQLDPDTWLLSDAAIERILNIDCDDGCPDRSIIHNLKTMEGLFGTEISTQIPETENHVLMINTWHYLVGQWREASDPRAPDLDQRAPSALEDKLLEIVQRVPRNDMWETNARPYSVFSIRALQLLASYSESPALKTSAEIALDFLATKFTFQSLHGKRLPPMRRQWDNKERFGLYDSDYVPYQFGVLTGDYVFDVDCGCVGDRCKSATRGQEFALDTALMSYRIPDVIVDHGLHPDGGYPGTGSWARMQARYSEGDYAVFKEPNYSTPGEGELEPAQEFYFRTHDYLNSAGGAYHEYVAFDQILSIANDLATVAAMGSIMGGLVPLDPLMLVPLPFEVTRLVMVGLLASGLHEELVEKAAKKATDGTDFVAKPTMLIGNHDADWPDVSSAELQTLVFRGNADDPWKSNNQGVYKNFALGYSTKEQTFGGFQPPVLKPAAEASVGPVTVRVLDPEATAIIFAGGSQYVVSGSIAIGGPTRASLGFYEVVPRSRFASAKALLDQVMANNSSGWGSSPYRYVMTVSGETLEFNPFYPDAGGGNPSPAPFLSINGQPVDGVHTNGPSHSATFPLLEVKQVDQDYQFTGVHYACARGDGLVIINNPRRGRRLVLDTRNPSAPVRRDEALVSDDCPGVLAGTF